MMRQTMTALADELTMFASQLREHVSGAGDPPNPARLDDWLAEYRDAFRLQRQYPNRTALAERLARVQLGPERGR